MSMIMKIEKRVDIKKLIRAPQKTDLLSAMLLFFCQRASLFGMYPFGVAFFAALTRSETAYLSLPALIIGSVLGGASTIKYLFASLIIWVYKNIIPEKGINYITGPLVCAGALIISGTYYAVTDNQPVYGLAILCAEALIASVCYPVFMNIKELVKQNGKNEPASKECAISLVILMSVVLWGLNGIVLPFSLSIKAVTSIYLVLCITMYQSVSVSAVFAFFCGCISILYPPDALVAGAVFAICVCCATLLKSFGQIGVSVGFLTGATILVLWSGDTKILTVSLADIFVSNAIFSVLPLKIHQKTGIFLANTFKPSVRRRDFRIKEYITEELNCFSNTLSEFADRFKSTFKMGTENKNSVAITVFDETAERLCSFCNKNSDCWQKNYNDTYKYMFAILDTTEKSGYCDIHNAPIVFTQRCIQPDLFLNEFNHVYEKRKEEILRNGERSADRNFVSNQYSEISRIINELSEEIKTSFFFDEQKENRILSECSNEGIYIKDINVIKNKDGYFEMFFAPGTEDEIDRICEIASEVLNMKMRETHCKNNAIVKLCTDNIFEVEVAVFQKNKDDESVSGDTVIHFETDKNKYYVILCDGMGSGEDALRESRMTAELLGGFLRAGFSKNTALSFINSTLALKMEREGFSTIDLCEIDLRSGITEFIKVGGAHSYIKQDKKLETVTSMSLPAGILEDICTENISRNLNSEDMVVMVSDGVSEAGYGLMRGEWIKKLMKLEGLSTEELSRAIVGNARKKIYPRVPDDMTAVVIKLHKIEETNEKDEEIVI